MPRSGGVYTLPSPPAPLVPNTTARAEDVNSIQTDIAAALTGSVPVDGSAVMTGPLTLSTSSPTAALQAASKGYVDAQITGGAALTGIGGQSDFIIGYTSPLRYVQWGTGWQDWFNPTLSSPLRGWFANGIDAMTLDGSGNLNVHGMVTPGGVLLAMKPSAGTGAEARAALQKLRASAEPADVAQVLGLLIEAVLAS